MAVDPNKIPEGYTIVNDQYVPISTTGPGGQNDPNAGGGGSTTTGGGGETPTPDPIDDNPTGLPSADETFGTDADLATSQADSKDRIAEEQASAREARRAQAESIFGPRIARAEDIGRKQVGTAEGASGQRAGFNLSTAESTFIKGVQDEVDARISEIQQQRDAYIAVGDANALQRADAALAQLEDKKTQMMLNKANYALGIFGAEQDQVGTDIQLMKALNDIPAGETIEIGGREYTGIGVADIDPFFTGSNIISIAQGLPVGESLTIFDPGLGENITIEGMDFNPDLGTTMYKTERGGEVFITTVDQAGNVVNQVSGGMVGKAPSAPSAPKDKLTQSVFNKLAASNVTEDQGRTIQSLLAGGTKEMAIQAISEGLSAQATQGRGFTSVTGELNEAGEAVVGPSKAQQKEAKRMVDAYIAVIGQENFLAGLSAAVVAGINETNNED